MFLIKFCPILWGTTAPEKQVLTQYWGYSPYFMQLGISVFDIMQLAFKIQQTLAIQLSLFPTKRLCTLCQWQANVWNIQQANFSVFQQLWNASPNNSLTSPCVLQGQAPGTRVLRLDKPTTASRPDRVPSSVMVFQCSTNLSLLCVSSVGGNNCARHKSKKKKENKMNTEIGQKESKDRRIEE